MLQFRIRRECAYVVALQPSGQRTAPYAEHWKKDSRRVNGDCAGSYECIPSRLRDVSLMPLGVTYHVAARCRHAWHLELFVQPLSPYRLLPDQAVRFLLS